MNLPNPLRILFDKGFTAQSLFKVEGETDKDNINKNYTPFANHFLNHSQTITCKKNDLAKNFGSKIVRSYFGSLHVDKCVSSKDGVRYPDELVAEHILLWNGSFSNPFFQSSSLLKLMRNHFTFPLDEKFQELQYSLLQFGEVIAPHKRGNEPVSQQVDSKCLAKVEFLEFCSLRAYPYQQIRRICSALRDSLLPLRKRVCHSLLRQALYNLGDIQDSALIWRRDITERGWFHILDRELKVTLERMEHNANETNSIAIIGEIYSYISQWHDCTGYRIASKLLIGFGDALDCQVKANQECGDEESKSRILQQLFTKQSIYYMMALCCYQYAPSLSYEDISYMCQLRVQTRRDRAISGLRRNDDDKDEELAMLLLRSAELSSSVDHIMSLRIREIVDGIANDFSCLTIILKKVIDIDDSDSKLIWRPLDHSPYCFEATLKRDTFDINLLSGCVLSKGSPLNSLPDSIRESQMYKRTFGNRNFDVRFLTDASYQTINSVDGKEYIFRPPDIDLPLLIVEVDHGVELELLDGTSQQTWQGNLPIRLRESCSHWLHRESGVLYFRGKSFSDRKVMFIAMNTALPLSTKSTCWKVYEVPKYSSQDAFELQKECIELRFESIDYRRLVLLNDNVENVRRIFNKFEDVEHIEFYDDKGSFVVHLPRFDLTFQMKDGQFVSNEFADFTLDRCQQLPDTFGYFSSYLVLRGSRSELRLLLPIGDLNRDEVSKEVTISCPSSDYNFVRKYYYYDVHERFHTVEAPDITSRLYLALVFCMSSTLLPTRRYNATGAEVALDLIRKCWVNTPLSEDQEQLVRSIQKHAWHFPALVLICQDLIDSGKQSSFLLLKEVASDRDNWQPFADADTEYSNSTLPRHFRSSLTTLEEKRIASRRKRVSELSHRANRNKEVSNINFCDEKLKISELKLATLFRLKTDNSSSEPFPIDRKVFADVSIIEKDVLQDLQESWEVSQGYPVVEICQSIEETCEIIQSLLSEVSAATDFLEYFILKTIDKIPRSDDPNRTVFRIQKAANLVPTICKYDLLRIAIDDRLLQVFNPFLSEMAGKTIKSRIVTWLQLCVLQDKLKRLRNHAKEGNVPQLVAELQVVRVWKVEEHLEWLVFEVEGQLQIRPIQYVIARHLIDSPGSIGQLNMGEGKTRVILPMLVLHLAKGDEIVRLHFLGQLLDEAFHYLHLHLCASALNRKIFRLPFSRDVKVGIETVGVMKSMLEYCRLSKGCLCVAPEHRLSLLLKSDELALPSPSDIDMVKDTISKDLRNMEKENSFVDILDEADEILRHKYELVYAVGEAMQRNGASAAWDAVQCLLRIIDKPTLPNLIDILRNPKIAVRSEPTDSNNLEFRSTRLIQGTELDFALTDFKALLMEELFINTPFPFHWLRKAVPDKRDIISFVTNANDNSFGLKFRGKPNEKESLLALRGLLGFEILVHCLQKCHRVHYGIKRPGKRRLAVPFLAADTPSERAEFQHPDVAVVYTTLAYYGDGLSSELLLEAFTRMMELGPDAQKDLYDSWFNRSRGSISNRDIGSLDDVRKIDLTNIMQRDLLGRYYSKNPEVINYWLSYIALPRESQQYSHRMTANSWHLCSNSKKAPIGFSGTDDNKMLLPMQVEQTTIPGHPELIGTNGKMLALLLRNREYVSIEKTNLQESSYEESNQKNSCSHHSIGISSLKKYSAFEILDDVAEHLKAKRASALIDAGGLIVDISNREVAKYLTRKLDYLVEPLKRAVVYFNTEKLKWYVFDKEEREWPLSNSPIREKDAFVYFDDRRCRGSDMKLQPDACAMVTIGPKMTKDKLMQAAGRMRQLDKGQRIFLAGPRDVTYQISALMQGRRTGSRTGTGGLTIEEMKITISSKDVMHWVLKNTTESLAPEGLMMWGTQGFHFCHTHQQPVGSVRMPELLTLQQLYGHTTQKASLISVIIETSAGFKARLPFIHGISSELNDMSRDILTKVEQRGRGYFLAQIGLDEECERELQNEKEVEKEEEKEVPSMQAVAEEDWDFQGLMEGKYPSAETVPSAVSLCEATRENSDILADIKWCERIFCTRNFMNTVVDSQGSRVRPMDRYLRLVHFIVVFRTCGSMLLLSERDADIILRLIHTNNQSESIDMVDLAYCKLAAEDSEAYKDLGPALPQWLPEVMQSPTGLEGLVSVQLFSGETMFKTEGQREALRKLLLAGEEKARQAALSIPEIRGLKHCLFRSDLEKVVSLL